MSPFPMVEITEGHTRLVVPKASIKSPAPPTTPVFFNPAASTNRDVSVAVVQASSGLTFCDSMTGVGGRGVRVANEVARKMHVTMIDMNSQSLRLAKRNAKLNGVSGKSEFVHSEANSFFYPAQAREDRFDFIDLDPFGTPAPYIQPMLTAVADTGIASITATDTAVLCGIHPDVARRRYGSTPLNNEFNHETAIRVLVNAVRRQGAAIDLGIQPVAVHSTRHYVRVFVRVLVGATKADKAAEGEGYVIVCQKCDERSASRMPLLVCPRCGSKAKCAGPLWTGSLTEPALVKTAATTAERFGFRTAAKILASLANVDHFPPWGYSLERICSTLGIPTVPVQGVAGFLRDSGFRCGPQPFELLGVKTDADHADVVRAVKSASRRRNRHGN